MNFPVIKNFAVDIPEKITFIFNNDIWKNCSTIYVNILNNVVYHSAGHITSPVTLPQNMIHHFQRVVTSQPQCQTILKKITLF